MNFLQAAFSPNSKERQGFINDRNKYILKTAGYPPYTPPSGGGGADNADAASQYSDPNPAATAAYTKKVEQAKLNWLLSKPPEQQKKIEQVFKEYSGALDAVNQVGKVAALGIVAASGVGALATGAGLIGAGAAGSGAGGAGGAGTITGGSGSLLGGGVGGTGSGLGVSGLNAGAGTALGGAGSTAAGTAGFGGTLGSTVGTGSAIGGGLLGGAGSIAGGAGSIAGGAGSLPPSAGTAAGAAGSLSSLFPKTGTDWLSAGLGAAGLANSLRSPDKPNDVDWQQLARDQAGFDEAALDKSLLANRTNQTNAQGDTQSWTQNPDGTWSQKQAFGESNQRLFDQSQNIKSGLLGQAAQAAPLTTEGLPDVGGPLMSARGNNQDIQNAWMSRIAPERDRQRQNEYARLAGMGLTEGTPAFANAMRQLNEADTDAQNQALIYGTQEYGQEYNRDIAGRQSQQNARTSMFNQRQAVSESPYRNLNMMAGATPGNPVFGSQVNRGTPTSTQTYQAGKDAYGQDVANSNVTNAQRGNLTDGFFGLANTINKGGWGKP